MEAEGTSGNPTFLRGDPAMVNLLLEISPHSLSCGAPSFSNCLCFYLVFEVFQEGAGEGNGNPLQYSCLENPMDRGAW